MKTYTDEQVAKLREALTNSLPFRESVYSLHKHNEARSELDRPVVMEPTELSTQLRETASKGVSVWGDLQLAAAKEIEILTAERECYAIAMDRMLKGETK